MKKLLCVLAVLMLMGCESGNYSEQAEAETVQVSYIEMIEGELYFIPEEREKQFHNRYAAFREEHPELRVIDVEISLEDGTYNATDGYFVFTEKESEVK